MKRNKDWSKVPAEKLPNGWEPKGAMLIQSSKQLRERIRQLVYSDDISCAIISKWYDCTGEPCPALQEDYSSDIMDHIVFGRDIKIKSRKQFVNIMKAFT